MFLTFVEILMHTSNCFVSPDFFPFFESFINSDSKVVLWILVSPDANSSKRASKINWYWALGKNEAT